MVKVSHFSSLERRVTISVGTLFGVRMLGLFMVLPVLANSVESLDDYSPLMLGLVIGAYGLTQAILQIPLGLLSDRLGRQTIILFGLTVFVIGSIVAAFADSMLDLLIGRALQGMGAIASTLMALVTDLTIEDNRSKAMAIIGGSIGFAFLLAMMVGPIVTIYLGLSGVFWMTALLGLLGICITIFFMPKISNPARNREADADIQQISALLRDRTLTRLNIGIFALHFALMAAFLVIPSILGKELSINTRDLPLAYLGLLGGGFFLMLPAMIWAEKHSKQKLVLLVAISVMAGATFILGIQRTIVLTPILLLVFFAAFNLLEAALPSWLSKSCPVGNRGTAMGIYSTSQFLGSFFGGLIGGWTLQYLGVDALFYLVGSIIFIWWLTSLSLQSPRPLKTLVLGVGELKHQEFIKIVSNITGVKDILLVQDENLAYVQVDRSQADMSSLQPYFNR